MHLILFFFLVFSALPVVKGGGSKFVDEFYNQSRCFPLSKSENCRQYQRCKDSHRCGNAIEEYDITSSKMQCFDQIYTGGNRTQIPLMNDFEDWKTGTFNWLVKGEYEEPSTFVTGLNSFNYSVIGSLELKSGNLLFDTDTARLSGDVNLIGTITTTLNGSQVALFNFMTVFMGEMLKVRLRGSRPLVIMSRSSFILNTKLKASPGTLGSFKGGGLPGINNANGPGSSSLRIYKKSIITTATNIDEVQEIETSASPGQTIRGFFLVSYMGEVSHSIPYNIETFKLQRILETGLRKAGELHVQEIYSQTPNNGRKWRITFLTAVGNPPELLVKSYLTGVNSTVVVRTLVQGNEISGYFRLKMWGLNSKRIMYNASEEKLGAILKESFPQIKYITVNRTDPFNKCVQGSIIHSKTASKYTQLCKADIGPSGGLRWDIEISTPVGNTVPKTPTSPNIKAASDPEKMYPIVNETIKVRDSTKYYIVNKTINTLHGIGVMLVVKDTNYFSLSLGGSGASHGGFGGSSSPFPPTSVYSDSKNTDLLGGSGGSGGGKLTSSFLQYTRPVYGGSGGGSIMLSSVNDFLIGESGSIHVNAEDGETGLYAGGGGSGGSIVLLSGGSLVMLGKLEANGGKGGSTTDFQTGVSGGGGGGGRISIFSKSFMTGSSSINSSIYATGGSSFNKRGANGTLYIESDTSLNIHVDPFAGAAGSQKSLLVYGSEPYVSLNSPDMRYATISMNAFKPTRISYFIRIGNFSSTNTSGILNNRGAIFGVHASSNTKDTILIGIGLDDGYFSHEANFYDYPRRRFHNHVHLNRWYKIDIFLDWSSKSYEVRLNDVSKVQNASFVGDNVGAIGLYNYHYMATWWDEIYVGIDHTMGFKCPESKSDGVHLKQRKRKLWPKKVLGGELQYHPKITHESHLSRRTKYQHNNGGLIPNDGQPHLMFRNDVLDKNSQASTKKKMFAHAGNEKLSFGELLYLSTHADNTMTDPLESEMDTDTLTTAAQNNGWSQIPTAKQQKGVFYWYSEVYKKDNSTGGIGACSTVDFLYWRNEGIMIHFDNLTDPFGDILNRSLIAERPKVLLNPATAKFVMWMHIDNRENEMGLCGVAAAEYPNGPFALKSSFYPDAPREAPGGLPINETHDLTVFTQPDNSAYLVRTYYKSVNYWLPRPQADDLWESVKKHPSGDIDFGLNYHRSYYHEGYDDVDDIYLQRWRMEDQPWKILCCDKRSNKCTENLVPPSQPNQRSCPEGSKKRIIGQGQGKPIESLYHDPHEKKNSKFLANSIPSHMTWGFQIYNTKTWRGNYFDALSTNITMLMFKRFAGEKKRQEILKDPTISYKYPNVFESVSVINVNDTEIMESIMNVLGITVSDFMLSKYASFDLKELDANVDGKISADEISKMKDRKGSMKKELYDSLLNDFERLKKSEISRLNSRNDSIIEFDEFEAWIGKDPDLAFNLYDLDKSGYLDENELSRMLIDRQIPRLDTILILLDPDFDGRVYYNRFEKWMFEFPDFLFSKYDYDKSNDLDEIEYTKLKEDIGPYFFDEKIFSQLINKTTNTIQKNRYKKWFSTSTSLIRPSRNELKVDNAPHPTRPDSLTGPLQVVQTRRAKYIAISKLTSDYLATEGLFNEIEGDFEKDDDDDSGSGLINMLGFSLKLFNLQTNGVNSSEVPFRKFLSPKTLGHRTTFWNGREREGRPSAPEIFLYGKQCFNIAGTETGCPDCANVMASPRIEKYNSWAIIREYCDSRASGASNGSTTYKEMNVFIKSFDQYASQPLRFQQLSKFGSQGVQPHYSPCINQSQQMPCDVHIINEGNVGRKRNLETFESPWEKHPNNVGSSVKIRASSLYITQEISKGPSFNERFPKRDRAPNENDTILATTFPDQAGLLLGGG